MNNSVSIFQHYGDIHLEFLKEAYNLLILAYKDLKLQKYNADSKNENTIRNDLVKIAKEKKDSDMQLRFITEFPDLKENSRIDIQLITALSMKEGEGSDITIECKIVGGNQYVNKNGISSFVSNKYASSMPIAGMIGFIKNGDVSEKIKKINELLDMHLNIITDENLQYYKLKTDFSESYQSIHQRKSNGTIALYHLFFDFLLR